MSESKDCSRVKLVTELMWTFISTVQRRASEDRRRLQHFESEQLCWTEPQTCPAPFSLSLVYLVILPSPSLFVINNLFFLSPPENSRCLRIHLEPDGDHFSFDFFLLRLREDADGCSFRRSARRYNKLCASPSNEAF